MKQPLGGRGSYVINLHPNLDIMHLVQPNTKLKELIGTSTPPRMNNGAEMCLSFLTKAGCWSNCKRAATHGATLQPAELQRVQQFLVRRIPRNTGNTASLNTSVNPPGTITGGPSGAVLLP